jgi:hypothetical protein
VRHQSPLPRERQAAPRFDGEYVSDDGEVRLRFNDDGSAEYGAATGDWRIDHGELTVRTAAWHCEGSLDLTAAYLACTAVEDHRERQEVVLAFRPDQ